MSDEKLDAMIEHGERFNTLNRDQESADLLAALRSLKTLRAAAAAMVSQYESMPDGTLGRGLTNGQFSALRNALLSSAFHDPLEK
jgi:hypothetical protein